MTYVVTEPECPASAIKPDTDPDMQRWVALNAEYAKVWPNISEKKAPPVDAKQWDGVADKFKKFFNLVMAQ